MEEKKEPLGLDKSVPATETKTSDATTTTPPPQPVVQDAPDPEEDDLDDLDELLDEFSATKVNDVPSAPSSSGPGRPPAPPQTKDGTPVPDLEGMTDDDFAKELQAGMANLLGDMETSPEMQQQFESLVKELSSAAALSDDAPETPSPPKPSASASKDATSSSSTATTADDAFQASILSTLSRMQNSSATASAAASNPARSSSNPDDLFASLLSQMGPAGADGAGAGPDGASGTSEEDLSSLLLTMMQSLTNKAILYEPMSELNSKFPAWLESHAAETKAEDLSRFKEQQKIVGEIVGKFEEAGYTDENVADREFVVERMQKMQELGSPPEDLVGGLEGGLAGLDALGGGMGGDDGCAQQ